MSVTPFASEEGREGGREREKRGMREREYRGRKWRTKGHHVKCTLVWWVLGAD